MQPWTVQLFTAELSAASSSVLKLLSQSKLVKFKLACLEGEEKEVQKDAWFPEATPTLWVWLWVWPQDPPYTRHRIWRDISLMCYIFTHRTKNNTSKPKKLSTLILTSWHSSALTLALLSRGAMQLSQGLLTQIFVDAIQDNLHIKLYSIIMNVCYPLL